MRLALTVGAVAVGVAVVLSVVRPAAVAAPPTAPPEAPGITIAASTHLDLPDPFLLDAGGSYYLYLSTAFGDHAHSHVPLLIGRPGHWSPPREALPALPSWAAPYPAPVWSPAVVRLDGTYVMYFAAELAGRVPPTHCIAVALSRSPAGPFVPVAGPPMVCQLSLGGDIDAEPFFDPSGPGGSAHPEYLVWKSDNNNHPSSGPTTIWAAPMADDGLQLTGRPVPIFRPDRPWQEPVLEAPAMVKAPDGSDWLFFSAGNGYFASHYAIGVARCAGPLGGCQVQTNSPLIASNHQGSGPGEETSYQSPVGGTWVLYSPWHTGELARLLRPVEAARIAFGPNGPYVAQAGTFPPP